MEHTQLKGKLRGVWVQSVDKFFGDNYSIEFSTRRADACNLSKEDIKVLRKYFNDIKIVKLTIVEEEVNIENTIEFL